MKAHFARIGHWKGSLMPNPLIQRQRNISTKPLDHDDAIPPRVDSYEGDNNPYRGIENHGVESKNRLSDVPEEFAPEDYKIIPYDSEDKDIDPIPVRVVHGPTEREFRTFLTGRAYATANASCIVARDFTRSKVRLRNISGVTVWLSNTPSVQVFSGYPIPTQTEFVYEGNSEIWAVSEDGNQQAIAILTEYTIAEK
jgi:hypothetical protein